MQLNLNRELLLESLSSVASAVERRNPMAVLANIKFELSRDKLVLTASDLELELKTTLSLPEGACIEAGATTMPAKKLIDIIKSLPPGAQVQLALSSADKCTIKAGSSRFSMGTLPAADFPTLGSPDQPEQVTVSRSDLKQLIAGTGFAMAVQDVRFYLTGMLFEVEGDEIRTIATDGHRLAFGRAKTAQNISETLQAVVPRKAINELQRLLGSEQGDLQLAVGREFLQVVIDITSQIKGAPEGVSLVTQFTARLIDGKFPDYLRVMMQDTTKVATVDRDQIKQVLQRVSILSHERSRGVIFEFKPEGKLQVRANNAEQDEAVEDLQVDYNGDEIEVQFNASYLLDVINVFDGPLRLNLTDPNASVLVNSSEMADFQYVIMPMRI